MKRRAWRRGAALLAASGLITSGCASHQSPPVVVTPAGVILVPNAPPERKTETPGPAPGAGYAWQGGYWTHQGGQWIWMPGRWERVPQAAAGWVPGYWTQDLQGWIWTPGHWE